MDESEPIGDHMMRGEGLVPAQQGEGGIRLMSVTRIDSGQYF